MKIEDRRKEKENHIERDKEGLSEKDKREESKVGDVEREGDYGHFCGSAPVFQHKFLRALKSK